MLEILKYFLLIIYAVLLVVYIIGSSAGASKVKEYSSIEKVSKNSLNNLLGFGYFLLQVSGYSYTKKSDLKRIDMCKILHGSKNAMAIYKVTVAQKVTSVYFSVMLAILLYLLTDNPAVLAIGILMAVLLVHSIDNTIVEKCTKHQNQLLLEFPGVVSKLALLINAGMTAKGAWKQVATQGRGRLYLEMQTAVDDMTQRGMSEEAAYQAFAERCGIPEIRKFVTLMIQNLQRGSAELTTMLISESQTCWEIRKHLARRAGERAKSLLLIPITMILVGVLVMILVPMFSGFGM